jgi:hypothetical protein
MVRFKYFKKLQRSVEFERCMKLLKANNGGGAMTGAMWLLYEEAYYSGRYSGLGYWKRHLNGLEAVDAPIKGEK